MSELRALRNTQVSDENGIVVTSSERAVASTLTAYDVGLPRQQSPFVRRAAPAAMCSRSSPWWATRTRPSTPSTRSSTPSSARARLTSSTSAWAVTSIASESTRVVEEDFALHFS